MSKIKSTCQTCGHIYELDREEYMPAHVVSTKCNWCPLCEDRAEDYWQEWWDEDENGGGEPILPIPDNQLCLPFIFDELGIEILKIETK